MIEVPLFPCQITRWNSCQGDSEILPQETHRYSTSGAIANPDVWLATWRWILRDSSLHSRQVRFCISNRQSVYAKHSSRQLDSCSHFPLPNSLSPTPIFVMVSHLRLATAISLTFLFVMKCSWPSERFMMRPSCVKYHPAVCIVEFNNQQLWIAVGQSREGVFFLRPLCVRASVLWPDSHVQNTTLHFARPLRL